MAPIKVGIIGFGFSTNCFQLPFILPNKDLLVYAFLQRAPPSAAATQKFGHCTQKFPQAKHYQTAAAFFGDPDIELVVVAAFDHVALATQALEAGKHVVVEKPVSSTSAEADALIALARAQGKLLSVFQNRRLDSDFRTVQHLVTAGALGDVTEAEIHFDPPPGFKADVVDRNYGDGPYTPGRGSVFDLGTHTIDQALVLFGKPAYVTAFFRSVRAGGGGVHDTFSLVLEYDGTEARTNLVVTVKTNVASVLKDQLRFVVKGTDGTFIKYGTCPQEDRAIAHPGVAADDPAYGVEDERIWGQLTTKTPFDAAVQTRDAATGYYMGAFPSLPGHYRGYYENIVDAIRGTAPLAVDPQTSRDGIRLIELARQSHETRASVKWTDA
ncbi:uncharacterized protein SPSK_09444 [Sporothrix schenckii 1099-18]|uniref:Oxidoreductase n=1 Tax=Sporothrix schenckii 1099-18 TaxID=1397361 RepID=A0A0F2M641_SPOSC|nr:uncharacterized protein SPSK_09444 [Sporothrix schenckii 1099-18]KJR85097.1 hypothetical protein SPSK_09444 [Sporothrix schenckii 1099-18]